MRFTTFKDYELLVASNGERLERWNDKILIRPDPQIIWNTEKKDPRWKNSLATYFRSNTGGGHWESKNNLENTSWKIQYDNLTFNIKLMNFKHTGVFPEQAVNWDLLRKIINNKPLKILNLFAYTGGATLACASAGASVCHVDASKGMVSWAKNNAISSHLDKRPIRWIVDDCEKFVLREIKRGNKYDGIIMDPPSYGRGPKGEIWKAEDKLFDFLNLCEKLLSENAKFLMINSYSSGLSPALISCLISTVFKSKHHSGSILCDEIGIPVSNLDIVLPAGNTGLWLSNSVPERTLYE